ncbi:MAG: hypothetical protein EOP23_04010 [Hyphomicrobiales bacterium]|nr:MAG: hypothetical protein EOP23_04010 [Hyphomicrobiales bacterium]
MARYFIDTFDGTLDVQDEVGADFTSCDRACAEARRAVRDMVRDYVDDGGCRPIGVCVRNRDGKTVYALRVDFSERFDRDD